MGQANGAPQHVATNRLRSGSRRRPGGLKIVVIEKRMTSTNQSLAHLSDDELLAAVKCLATRECRATAALVRSLMELDARRLYLGEGYSSLFTYCTQALHLAEGAAHNRIEAARAARRFPAILTALEDGAVTLTTVRLVAPHLTTANQQDVLARACHKGKREVEALVASLRPLPSVPSTIRKLPEPRPVPLNTKPVVLTSTTAAPGPPVVTPAIGMASRPMETPLAPERYKLQFTISGETHAKLRRVQALGRHVIPSGDPAEIFDRALTLLLIKDRCDCESASSHMRDRDSASCAFGSCYDERAGWSIGSECDDSIGWKGCSCECASVGGSTSPCIEVLRRCRSDRPSGGVWISSMMPWLTAVSFAC